MDTANERLNCYNFNQNCYLYSSFNIAVKQKQKPSSYVLNKFNFC